VKKRIAVWLHGGIGTGHFSQGIPMLEKLLERLSETFEIVIYSQSTPHPDFDSPCFRIRSAPVTISAGFIRWFYLIKYFIQDHARHRFQVLFAFWGYPAGFVITIVGKLFALPSVIYLQGGDSAGIPSINFGILHKPFISRLVKWAYLNATLLLAMTRFQRDSLTNNGVDRTVHIVPSGADLSMYPFIAKTSHQIIHIIHVGHLTPVKDQATLLKAFALLLKKHPAELRIFGVDCLNGQMQRLSKELGIEEYVHFHGMIPYSKMPEQYAWADIMFHTSLSEGQSMALTEAAACGVLMAGTRVGLLYDLGEEYGLTVEPGDYKGLTEKVDSILNDPEDWKNRIHRARKWSKSHDLSWTADELTKLIQTV
jgi:glycosyltransferase involved in cell wall biosynthesis